MSKSPASLRRIQDVAADLLDVRVGIIQYIFEQPKEAGAPDFFRYVAQASNTRAFCPQANFAVASAAAGRRDTAIAKTLGEAIERYCAAIFHPHDFPLVAYREADFSCVHPHDFALYLPEQYKQHGFIFQPFAEDTLVRWAPVVDLGSAETVCVPACFVYVPYTFSRRAGEVPIAQPISTGLACHCSLAEAALGGICEVIERDAFTITWQARLARPHIRLESLSDANQDLVRRLERSGYRVTLLDATNDSGVPTIMGVMRNPLPNALPLVFAAAASLDPEEAVRKSLEELAHTERYMWQIKATVPAVPYQPGHRNIVDQVSHLSFWTNHDHAAYAEFIFSSTQAIDFQDIPNHATGDPRLDLDRLVTMVQRTGHRVLLADVTSPDVDQLGLKVVRAIIPGYHPLFMGYIVRALGGTRLWEVPQKLGYSEISRENGDNALPHPFP